MKLLNKLFYQLNTDHKIDALKCLIVYDRLSNITGGVWTSDWNPLTKGTFIKFDGEYKLIQSLSPIGEIFYRGLESYFDFNPKEIIESIFDKELRRPKELRDTVSNLKKWKLLAIQLTESL